jgi:hypothetical protein
MKQGPHLPVTAIAAVFSLVLGLGACGGPEGDENEVVAPLETAILDSFDDGDVSDWRDFFGGGSIMSHRLSSSRAKSGTTSMKLMYTVAAGGYVGVEKLFSSGAGDWSGGSSLEVWVDGEGSRHTMRVQIYDAGWERWQMDVVVDFDGWQLVSMPFAQFTRSPWQPSSAVQNGSRDLAGVRGMSIIPLAPGGATGALYLDSMTVQWGSSSTQVALAPAAPSAPVAAPTATATATAGKVGTVIPLYSFPTHATWTSVIAAKTAHPTVPVMAVVSPANGPNTKISSSYTTGIARLLAAGIKVIGYVYTSYTARPEAEVRADIDRWRSFYPGVTGIFFDEQMHRAGGEGYYQRLTDYAKSRGFDFTIGNPGADSIPSYIGTVDMILIYESSGLPSLTRLEGWHSSYPKSNFGIIPYNVGSLDPAAVQSFKQRVGYVYLTNDTLPNPWDTLPSYFDALLGQLAQ